MKKTLLSAIIIAKNEEEKISACIKSVSFADEIIVVDSGSEDKTIEISKKLGANIFKSSKKSFKDWRNEGLKNAKGDWILYIDADERVGKELKKEIVSILSSDSKHSYFVIPRKNKILGKFMKHGGWYPDYVKRLFRKEKLVEWVNDLHEEPIVMGSFGYLKNDLLHIKHDNLFDMVEKTNRWSEIEAKLLYDSKHPRMETWRFIRIMATEFIYRMIKKRAFLDGKEGVLYAIYQVYSRFLSYAKLWEMQLKVK